MRSLLAAAVLMSALCVVPSAARAGFGIEGSVGKGGQVSEPRAAEQATLMLAPGFQFLMVRFSLGLVNNLPDTEAGQYNLELRPMIGFFPPILPIYGRIVFAFTDLLGREDVPNEIAYGGAAGFKLGLGPVGVFAEAGVLPRSRRSEISWVVEGRVGVALGF